MSYQEIFKGLGVQITFSEYDKFSIIKETLTRIGIPSSHQKTLYQTAHILHKRGMYGILHFKELFVLDGKQADIAGEDIDRRNQIANYLCDWGLVQTPNPVPSPRYASMTKLKIIPSKERSEWELVPKYTVGR